MTITPAQDFKTALVEGMHKFYVTFYGEPLGFYIINNGNPSGWVDLNPELTKNFAKSRTSNAPAVVNNIHPAQSFIGRIIKSGTQRDYFGRNLDCLSGIKIYLVPPDCEDPDVTLRDDDVRTSSLCNYLGPNGSFKGKYEGPIGIVGLPDFDKNIDEIWREKLPHVFSGQELKAALNQCDGLLSPAMEGRTFTHIAKFADLHGGREAMPILEFVGMSASRAAGLKTPDFGLVSQGPDFPPVYVVERFDIPAANSPSRERYILQDFASLNGYDPQNNRIEGMLSYQKLGSWFLAHLRNKNPENVHTNMRQYLTSIVSMIVLNDSDKHWKNLSTLTKVNLDTGEMVDFGLSPTYDVFPDTFTNRHGSRLRYKLRNNGHEAQPRFPMVDVLQFMREPDLSVDGRKYSIFDTDDEAAEFVREIASRVAFEAVRIATNPPSALSNNAFSRQLEFDLNLCAAITVERAKLLDAKLPDFDADAVWKENRVHGPKQRKKWFDPLKPHSFVSGITRQPWEPVIT